MESSKNSGIPRVYSGEDAWLSGDFMPGTAWVRLEPIDEAWEPLTATHIRDNVKAANPQMMQCLSGMSIPSSHLRGPFAPDLSVTAELLDEECRQKHDIQIQLLAGYDLVLSKLTALEQLSCSCPYCFKDGVRIASGTFFLTLVKGTRAPESSDMLQPKIHYRLICLEKMFNRGATVSLKLALDGQEDESEEEPVGMPHDYPSNSAQALRLRKRRLEEAEEIVADVQAQDAKRVKRLELRQTIGIPDESVDLKLRRPDDLSPYDIRYKKQGRTHSGEKKARVSDGSTDFYDASDKESIYEPPTKVTRALTALANPNICVCQEPAGDRAVVSCSNEKCLIGAFHLECIGEQQLSSAAELYCKLCQHIFDGLGTATRVAAAGAKADELKALNAEVDVSSMHSGTATKEEFSEFVHYPEDEDDQFSEFVHWPDDEADGQTQQVNKSPSTHPFRAFVAANDQSASTDSTKAPQVDGPSSLRQIFGDFKLHADWPRRMAQILRGRGTARPPPGSFKMAFTDLAPFIFAKPRNQLRNLNVLSDTEESVLDHWKRKCPRSRLMTHLPEEQQQEITSKAPDPEPPYFDAEGRQVTHKSDCLTYKLSEILAKAGDDEAREQQKRMQQSSDEQEMGRGNVGEQAGVP